MKKKREKMNEIMKRDKDERKSFFFPKNVSRPSNPPDELAQNVSKKNPFRTNYSSIFSSKVQNLAVFSFIYMIRIRFFGPQELIQKYFRRARYTLRCFLFPGSQAHDAWHHGRYEPNGQFQSLVQCWFCWWLYTSRCVSFPAVMPLMLVGRPVGRSASCPVWTRRKGYIVPCIRSCSFSTRSLTFLSYRRGSSLRSRLFRRPKRFPSCCSISGGRSPCFQVVIFPVVTQRLIPWSR